MTKIKARNYNNKKQITRSRKENGKCLTKKKQHKHNLSFGGGGGSRSAQKGGSSAVFKSRFIDGPESEFEDINNYYQKHILVNLCGAAGGSGAGGSGEAAGATGLPLTVGPGFKKVNSAGLGFTLKNPFDASGGGGGGGAGGGAGGDGVKSLEEFQRVTRDNMAYFKNESIRREITNVMLHGNLFGLGESYFQVPPNIVVCILPEINYYASIYETNRIFRKGGGVDNESLFDDIFLYLAQMTQGEEFKFKNIDRYESGLVFPDYFCSNTFRNSSWFYPGQFCYNVTLSGSANKYKKELLDVVDIYETYTFDDAGNRKKKIKYKSESLSLTKIFQRPEMQRGKFITNLCEICTQDPITRRVIILEACQALQQNVVNFSFEEYELFKKTMFFQHQANVNLPGVSGSGSELTFLKREEGSKIYKYLCLVNPINCLYILDYFTANIGQVINFGFQKIRDFDKNKRTIEEAINMFLASGHLNESYQSFIKTLNFTEMIGFLDLLKKGGGGGEGEARVRDFCKLYLDNHWFHKNKYLLPATLIFYQAKSEVALNSQANILKIISDKLDELGILKSYLDVDTRFPAFDFYEILRDLLGVEKSFLLVNPSLMVPSLGPLAKRSIFKTAIFQKIEKIGGKIEQNFKEINDIVNRGKIKEFVIEESKIDKSAVNPNILTDILKIINSCGFLVNLVICKNSFLGIPIIEFKNISKLTISNTKVRLGSLKFDDSLSGLTAIQLINLEIEGGGGGGAVGEVGGAGGAGGGGLDLHINLNSLDQLTVEDCKFSHVFIGASQLKSLKFYNGGDMLKFFIIDCPYLQEADLFNITFLAENLPKISRLDSLKFERCKLVGEFDFAAVITSLKYLTVIEMVDGEGTLKNLEDLIIKNYLESMILENCNMDAVDDSKMPLLINTLTDLIEYRNLYRNNFTLRIDDEEHGIMQAYLEARDEPYGGGRFNSGDDEFSEGEDIRPCRA